MTLDKGTQIIDKAKEMGAAMAGIASVELLKKSPSHEVLRKIGTEIDGVGSGFEIADFNDIKWPAEARSALVIAVSHPQDKPELDWWSAKGSPGNRTLIRINRELCAWIERTFGIKTHRLPYAIEKGGIYLKDAAVLAGLGCIGKNNLLVTPELGSRVRLRAMLLEEGLTPTGPIVFDPCDGCEELCRKACPQNAYEEIVLSPVETGMVTLPGRNGYFGRAKCMIQMGKDIENSGIAADEMEQFAVDIEDIFHTKERIKYCRRCELACPVGNL
jgi:epoxyqueuosine reductase